MSFSVVIHFVFFLIFADGKPKGIIDRTNFYEPAEEREDGAPVKPDTSVLDICLTAVVYSAYLALHYFRKNPDKAGKLVSTASMAGLYPSHGLPVYTSAKHGVSLRGTNTRVVFRSQGH